MLNPGNFGGNFPPKQPPSPSQRALASPLNGVASQVGRRTSSGSVGSVTSVGSAAGRSSTQTQQRHKPTPLVQPSRVVNSSPNIVRPTPSPSNSMSSSAPQVQSKPGLVNNAIRAAPPAQNAKPMRAAPPPATTATRAAPPPASPQGSVKSLSGFDDHDASVEALMAEKENLVDALYAYFP